MKNVLVALGLLSILLISSCSNSNSLLGGSWSFKGVSYTAYSAVGSTTAKTLTATTGSTSEINNVVFHFNSFPPAPGNYAITNVPVSSAGQVYVIMNIGTKTYTLSNTASSVATVTVSGSKVNVSVPSVEFTNTVISSPDAGLFSANISQNL
jgi:hypothetical protein